MVVWRSFLNWNEGWARVARGGSSNLWNGVCNHKHLHTIRLSDVTDGCSCRGEEQVLIYRLLSWCRPAASLILLKKLSIRWHCQSRIVFRSPSRSFVPQRDPQCGLFEVIPYCFHLPTTSLKRFFSSSRLRPGQPRSCPEGVQSDQLRFYEFYLGTHIYPETFVFSFIPLQSWKVNHSLSWIQKLNIRLCKNTKLSGCLQPNRISEIVLFWVKCIVLMPAPLA